MLITTTGKGHEIMKWRSRSVLGIANDKGAWLSVFWQKPDICVGGQGPPTQIQTGTLSNEPDIRQCLPIGKVVDHESDKQDED